MTSINFCVMDLLTLCNAHSSNTIFIYSFACLYNLYIVYYLLLKVIIQCNRLKKSSHSKIKLKRFTRSHKNNIYKNEKQTNGAWEMKNTETHKKIYIYITKCDEADVRDGSMCNNLMNSLFQT